MSPLFPSLSYIFHITFSTLNTYIPVVNHVLFSLTEENSCKLNMFLIPFNFLIAKIKRHF